MDRFSLLLLEPSEIYFEDFKVVYHTNPEEKNPSVHNEIPGRLKVNLAGNRKFKAKAKIIQEYRN